ncbi:hypothetical protein NL676_033731 [Syzygium grande]|nr:hypothetical protein NL676_033731 [Syzygium grande]
MLHRHALRRPLCRCPTTPHASDTPTRGVHAINAQATRESGASTRSSWRRKKKEKRPKRIGRDEPALPGGSDANGGVRERSGHGREEREDLEIEGLGLKREFAISTMEEKSGHGREDG